MIIKIADTKQDIKKAYDVRAVVFIHEQNVPPELEHDEHDEEAIHLIGYKDNQPIAASRVRFIDNYGKLERICVLKEYRGESYGSQMIQFMEGIIAQHGYHQATLNAQTHAENFYKHLGYHTVSDEFLDAGIPHVTMVKKL